MAPKSLLSILMLLVCDSHGYAPFARRRSFTNAVSSSSSSSSSTRIFFTEHDEVPEVATPSTTSVNNNNNDVMSLKEQAEALRREVQAMERELHERKEEKMRKEQDDIDRWLDHLLVNRTFGETQVLNTVDQVAELLKNERFSPDQVYKVFDRICETTPTRARDRQSPLCELLVNAAGKLDQMERKDNPNKRWNGRVERDLRKKLFAMEWGIDLEAERDDYD